MSAPDVRRVPPLERTMTLPSMVAYAGATWDWHRIHYDLDYLKSVRLDAPVVDGQVFGALLAEQATAWSGPQWRLAELGYRFGSLVFAGETVRCELTVDGSTHDAITLSGRVVVVGDERAAVSRATITLVPRP